MTDTGALELPAIAESMPVAPVDAGRPRRRAERILAGGALIGVVVSIGACWYAQQSTISLMTTDADGNIMPNWLSATVEASVTVTQQAAGLLFAAAVLLATLSFLRPPQARATSPRTEAGETVPVVPVGTPATPDALPREARTAATDVPDAPAPQLAPPPAEPLRASYDPADLAAFRRPTGEG